MEVPRRTDSAPASSCAGLESERVSLYESTPQLYEQSTATQEPLETPCSAKPAVPGVYSLKVAIAASPVKNSNNSVLSNELSKRIWPKSTVCPAASLSTKSCPISESEQVWPLSDTAMVAMLPILPRTPPASTAMGT